MSLVCSLYPPPPVQDIPKLTNILKYHVSANQQRPSRNGRSYDTLCLNEDGTPKETGVLVTVDTADSFIRSANTNSKVLYRPLSDPYLTPI